MNKLCYFNKMEHNSTAMTITKATCINMNQFHTHNNSEQKDLVVGGKCYLCCHLYKVYKHKNVTYCLGLVMYISIMT